MGGEEFAILLPQTDVAGAQVLGQRLLDLIAQTQFAGVRGRSVTASLGIAMWQPTDADLDTTMHRADAALYQAKAAGRNCLQVAEDAPTLPAPEPTAA
jgi:diguanylate cyclase (GGDEF)-like protein